MLLLDSCNIFEKLCAYFFLEKDNYSRDEQADWSSQNTGFADEDVNGYSSSNKKIKKRKSDFARDTM